MAELLGINSAVKFIAEMRASLHAAPLVGRRREPTASPRWYRARSSSPQGWSMIVPKVTLHSIPASPLEYVLAVIPKKLDVRLQARWLGRPEPTILPQQPRDRVGKPVLRDQNTPIVVD